MLSLIRGISKTEGTNIAKQKQTHREQISGYHDGWRGARGKKVKEIQRYQLAVMK